MSETTQNPQESTNQVEQTAQEQNQQPAFNPFSDNSWVSASEDGVVDIASYAKSSQEQTQEVEEEEEILDPSDWLKREFEWDSVDSAKQELEELRKLRDSAQDFDNEVEFENEESLNLFRLFKEGKQDEVYNYLSTRQKLNSLVEGEINKDSAVDIVKMKMRNNYPELTDEEINFQFNRNFGVPAKPVQKDIETDEEYQERLDTWQTQVKEAETELMIEAKLAKPDLQKYLNELVFPDIENGNDSYEPTQEELEAQQEFVNQFANDARNALSSFEGFSVSVKDEEVDIPLSYAISDEEKDVVARQIEQFVDAGFDANAILAERWLTEGGINTAQIVRDLALLLSEGKMSQKFVNEAASRRLAEHIRRTSNINVTSRTPQNTFSPESKSHMDKQIEYIWKNS